MRNAKLTRRQGSSRVEFGRRLALALAVAGLLLPLALLAPARARADEPDSRQATVLAVAGPDDVPLGNLARIVAKLRDASGKPLAGSLVVFTSPAEFAGAIGEMVIGEVRTNEQGEALLDYQLRVQGQNQFTARFLGDDGYKPSGGSMLVSATGEAQLSQRTAGVKVPVLGSWTIVLVLVTVWSVYGTTLVLVARIATSERHRVKRVQSY